MLETKITTKQQLIQLIQAAQIKKIMASDVHNKDDLAKVHRDVEQLMRLNANISIIVVTT